MNSSRILQNGISPHLMIPKIHGYRSQPRAGSFGADAKWSTIGIPRPIRYDGKYYFHVLTLLILHFT
jgi:hypothetical protein